MNDEYDDIRDLNPDRASTDAESAALAAWLAFEQGVLGEAPLALAAWLDSRRFTDVR